MITSDFQRFKITAPRHYLHVDASSHATLGCCFNHPNRHDCGDSRNTTKVKEGRYFRSGAESPCCGTFSKRPAPESLTPEPKRE